MATQRVGFLGLGVMGKQMAQRLLKQGTEVVVWNRSADKCAPLVALGATALATPAEVVDACSVTHGMLADPKASEAVCLGADGVASAAKVGKSYLDHSTIDEATGARLAAAVGATGARFLAAPVSGGWRDAAAGELLFVCGGDRTLFDEVTARRVLAVMGSKHWHVGESSEGPARAKLMLQIMMGTYIAALGETLALADKAGLDQAQIMDMFDSSAMANPISKAKGQLMIDGDDRRPIFRETGRHRRRRRQLRAELPAHLQQRTCGWRSSSDDLAQPAPLAAAANAQYVAARKRATRTTTSPP
ncbi:3-hydroxyisobutyrate dehydrogenase [Aureococcus anophagefferens]|nr:3-hydroxyisobutyrate dehydrogenase [Aureococcus anophagefferens]